VTKSRGPAEAVTALRMLPCSLSVHRDGEPERRPVHLAAVAAGVIPEGFGADDCVGLLFQDRRLVRVVASRPGKRCVRVRRAGGAAVESPVHVELLADPEPTLAPADVREFRALRYGALRDAG
jgi:dipeptidase E